MALTEGLLNPLLLLSDEEHETLTRAREILVNVRNDEDFRDHASGDWASLILTMAGFFGDRGTHLSPRASGLGRLSSKLRIPIDDLFYPDYPAIPYDGDEWHFVSSLVDDAPTGMKGFYEELDSRRDLINNLQNRTLCHEDSRIIGKSLGRIIRDGQADFWGRLRSPSLMDVMNEVNSTYQSDLPSTKILTKKIQAYVKLAHAYDREAQSMNIELGEADQKLLGRIARAAKMTPSRRIHELMDQLYVSWVKACFHSAREIKAIPKAYREAMRTGMLKDFQTYLDLIEESLNSPKDELVFEGIISSKYRAWATNDTSSGRFRMSDEQRDGLIKEQRKKLAELQNEALIALLMER